MDYCKQIDLAELLDSLDGNNRKQIYADENFHRETATVKLESDTDLEIMPDSLNASGLKCYYISIISCKSKTIKFNFTGTQISQHQTGLINDSNKNLLYWIPKNPVSRNYDSQDRIVSQKKINFTVGPNEKGLQLHVKDNDNNRVEFCILVFTKYIESFIEEICNVTPVERRRVTRSFWFRYERMENLCDYFINGRILSVRHLARNKAKESQNLAFILYYYLDFLYLQTRKKIYRLLCDFIAYSSMLSFPDDGRWRHGIWTDIAETHAAHQTAGIHLLLSHYQRTAAKIFLKKAALAADYLISIADNLHEDQTWFLHDTLETNPADAALFYNLFGSTAFGKSTSNTLCINTHIATLTALHRLDQLSPAEKYSTYFQKGLSALKKVLQANPCNWLYSCAYRLRDLLMRLCTKTENKLAKKLLKVWTLILIRHLLPFLKKKFPRLVMPNGFIERDLSYSALSDFYHFRNIEDILILCNLTKADWLLEIVTKSVKYTVDSRLADYVLSREPKAILFLDILLLYSDMVDEQYLPLLPKYLADFQKSNSAVPVNILSDPFITNTSLPLYVDNENVIVLAPAAGKNFKAVLINPTDKDRKVVLKLLDEADDMEIADSENRKFSPALEVVVPKMDFVKVVSKNG